MAWWLSKLNFCVSESNYSYNMTHLMSGFWFLTNSSGLLTFFCYYLLFSLTDRRVYTLVNYSFHYDLMHTSTNSSAMVKHVSCLWWSRIDMERFLRPNCKCILCSWNGLVNKDLVPTRLPWSVYSSMYTFSNQFILVMYLPSWVSTQVILIWSQGPYGLFKRD